MVFMKKIIIVLIIFYFTFPFSNASANLVLWESINADKDICRMAGRGASTFHNTFSKYVQGYKEPLKFDGAFSFIEDNTAYLNNALAKEVTLEEDKLFLGRIIKLAKSGAYLKIDWEEPGGSSPTFILTLLVKNLSYSVSYLRSKKLINNEDLNIIKNYINQVSKKLLLTSKGRYESEKNYSKVAIDQKISAPSSMIMWGVAINDKSIFDKYLKELLEVLKILDKKKYFAKDIRHNNEAMHHLVQISEILRLNNFDLYSQEFKKGGSIHNQIVVHALKVLKAGNKKLKTSGDKTAKAQSIMNTRGFGTHLAWIPFYFRNPQNKSKDILALHKKVSGQSLDPYYGGQIAIHSGCYYGKIIP
jgi:hypothetical protein